MFLFSDLKCSCWNSFLPEELLALLRGDLNALPEGKNILVPEKLWVNRFSADLREPQGCEWVAHREFADLQMVLQGNELCFLDCLERCDSVKAYNPEQDCEMFTHAGKDFQSIFLTPGTAVLIPPNLVHLPDVVSASFSGKVPKLVAKIHRSLLR